MTVQSTGTNGSGFTAISNSGNNTYNGFYSGGATSGSRQKYIGNMGGYLAFGRADDAWSTNEDQMVILNNGNVGIGTTSPGHPLDVNGNVRAVSFITTSDGRLKHNVRPVEGIEAILKLSGVRYQWNSTNKSEIGLIAQDVEQVFPEVVVTDDQGMKAVKYQNLIAPVIEATKEIYGMCEANTQEIVQAKRELASVQGEVQQLKNENSQLKKQVDDLSKRFEALEKAIQAQGK